MLLQTRKHEALRIERAHITKNRLTLFLTGGETRQFNSSEYDLRSIAELFGIVDTATLDAFKVSTPKPTKKRDTPTESLKALAERESNG